MGKRRYIVSGLVLIALVVPGYILLQKAIFEFQSAFILCGPDNPYGDQACKNGRGEIISTSFYYASPNNPDNQLTTAQIAGITNKCEDMDYSGNIFEVNVPINVYSRPTFRQHALQETIYQGRVILIAWFYLLEERRTWYLTKTNEGCGWIPYYSYLWEVTMTPYLPPVARLVDENNTSDTY